jgi:hypothetical protein
MKRILTVIAIASLMTACSSTKSSDPIANQKLSTSFVNEQIKIETKCSWFGMGSECNIVAIESTGTAPSYGATVSNRKMALTRAEMRAKANVAEFMDTQVSTTRVQSTIAKNIDRKIIAEIFFKYGLHEFVIFHNDHLQGVGFRCCHIDISSGFCCLS